MEQFVLNTKKIKEIVDANNVSTIRADFTHKDPEIAELLNKLGVDASGLPVLAIFPAGKPNKPIVITGMYSQAHLIKVLTAASSPSAEMTSRNTQSKPTKSAKKPKSTDLSKHELEWKPFTVERLKREQAGSPVLVHFDADWDSTSKVIEKFVLNTEEVKAAVERNNVIALKADCTSPNKIIDNVRCTLDACGVQVVAYFPNNSPEAIILDGMYTTADLIRVIEDEFSVFDSPPSSERLILKRVTWNQG